MREVEAQNGDEEKQMNKRTWTDDCGGNNLLLIISLVVIIASHSSMIFRGRRHGGRGNDDVYVQPVDSAQQVGSVVVASDDGHLTMQSVLA